MTWTGFDRERSGLEDTTSNARLVKRQARRCAAQDWVREALTEKAPWLLEGTSPPPEAIAIVKQLLKYVNTDGDVDDRRLRRNFLIRGIETGRKEKRWTIPVPSQTLRTPLPKPTITERNFGDLARVAQLRQAFLDSLRDPAFPEIQTLLAIRKFTHTKAPLGAADLEAGRVLLAAILFGGITDKSKLEAIAQCGPRSLFCYGDRVWMEWPQLSKVDAGVDRWHRWYPEQISGFLVARAHRDKRLPLVRRTGNLSCSEAIWKRIEAILALLPSSSPSRPRSLSQLLASATTWLSFDIPPLLAAYASGRVYCASLPPEAHLRMLSGQPVVVRHVTPDVDGTPPPRQPVPPGNIGEDAALDFMLLRRDLRAALKRSSEKHKAIRAINTYLARKDLSPVFVRLAEWVRELCDHHKDGDVRRRLSSIHDYLALIDKPLAVASESRDPAGLDAEELKELYAEILDGVGEKRAGRAVHPLMLFHRFLVSAHGVHEDMGEVFDGRSTGGSVDANPITEREYHCTLALLEPEVSGQPDRLARMQGVALTLGFRGKLRRGEVRRLRIGDICGAVYGVIYIRTTDKGQVKSTAGIRNLSLYGHFSSDEMAILRAFVISRLRDITGSDDLSRILSPYDEGSRQIRLRPLFEHSDKPGDLVPEQSLFDPIVDAMIQATCDPTSHYHLLRKGGQNWVFPGLMEEELPGCSLHFDPSGAIAGASPRLNEELLATSGPDKRKLWALSACAGHASPSTTVGSYLHCLDWLLSYALQQRSPELTTPLLSALTGLTQNNIRVLRSQKKIALGNYVYWIGHQDRGWFRRVAPVLEPLPEKSPQMPHAATKAASKPPLPGADTIVLVNAVVREGKDVVVMARRNGLLAEVVEPWIASAIALDRLVGKSRARAVQPSADSSGQDIVAGFGIQIDRRIAVCLPPRQRDECQSLNHWTAAIHGFARDRPNEAATWLNTFWRERRPKEHATGFRHLDRARVFLETLHTLAPERPLRLAYRLYPLENTTAILAKTQVEAWSVGLGIPAEEITLCLGVARQYDGDGIGTLTVSVPYEHKLSRETQKKREKGVLPQNLWHKTESIALEGACYVAAIWMLAGLYGKESAMHSATAPLRPAQSQAEQDNLTFKRMPEEADSTGETRRPELVILCGIPGAGKTTLYEKEFVGTHVHLSLDTTASGSRSREWNAFSAAIARSDSIVVDNTNLTPKHRERYITPARAAGYRIVGIELVVTTAEALHRIANQERKISEAAVRTRAMEFVGLRVDEGFDRIFRYPLANADEFMCCP